MTSRERVINTLLYEVPDRVARSFNDSDVLETSYEVATRATEWMEVGGGRWERLDDWGNIWARVDPTSKGEVAKGVLDNLADLESLALPDFSDPRSYDAARSKRSTAADKYLLGRIPGFAFNISRKLRRLDQYLVDILDEPARIHRLHDRIDGLIADMIRNYAEAGVDGVMFCEDWGTQHQLLVDPALWHEEYMPRFKRLCGMAHDTGVTVWMHSCGQIEAIVPSLMRAGIDVLQFDQPELHGLDTLAAHQDRAKITFWCPVDIQKILPRHDEALIRARAREMLKKLWRGRGGFIAGYYEDNASLGLTPVWQSYACEEFERYGVNRFCSEGR